MQPNLYEISKHKHPIWYVRRRNPGVASMAALAWAGSLSVYGRADSEDREPVGLAC